jgi:two-component system nitrogen regulation response regulator GlnG
MNAKPLQVWLVDDDASIRWVLEKALKGGGMAAKSFDQADSVLTALRGDAPDVLMTDIRMPGRSGLDLLKEIQLTRPGLPVIVMTAHSDLDAAVAAYQGGAFEYLPKPFDIDKAVDLVRRAAQQAIVSIDAEAARRSIPELLGQAAAMQQVFRAIGRLSRSSMTVLITGESGTGKELVARALHRHSPRSMQDPSSRSTPRRSPPICWSRNCSAMRRAPLPGRTPCAAAASSRPTPAPCS